VSDRQDAARPDERASVFISYRRQDSAPYAGRLYDALVELVGEGRVFMDVDTIQPGVDFEELTLSTLARSSVVLAVVGPGWLTAADEHGRRRLDDGDDFVRREVELALANDVAVVPVLVAGARMPAREQVPASIAAFCRRQAVEMSDRRWRADVAHLVEVLERAGVPAAVREPRADTRSVESDRGIRRRPLPVHRTRFVGREHDTEQVAEMLSTTGFVTITGPGGVGKSRLAVEVARRVEAEYADGVALAELASIDDPVLVVQRVATAARAAELEREATMDWLVERLADRRLLLILDNCEHVIDAAAAVAEAVLRGCAGVHVLATSREALQVDGEAVWRLDPLGVPEADDPLTAAELPTIPGAVLFADRAALVAPGLVLDDHAAAAIGAIVSAIDGVPLALELAAASLRSVRLDDLVTGISDVMTSAGTSRRRTADERQRTVRATVEWSYRLLDDVERLVLDRLGSFAGSFAAGDAETVCGAGLDPGGVTSAIVALADRSLVEHARTASRHRLLFAVRELAREHLAERPGDPTTERLIAWAADTARVSGREVDVGDELAGLAVLDAEHPNVVAALAVALREANTAMACELVSSLAPYWELRGLSAEGQRWVDEALALSPTDPALLARCSMAAARMLPTADFDGRRRRWMEALAAADSAGDDSLASTALAALGHIEAETEHRAEARTHLDAALARARAARDAPATAVVLLRLALCEQNDGDAARASELLDEATDLYRQAGNRRGELWCLAEVGMTHLVGGDVDHARQAFERGLALADELGYAHGEGWMRDGLGEAEGAAGRFTESRSHFEAANAVQLRLGDELNRGWTLGGLVRACARTGDLVAAIAWLGEWRRSLVGAVVPLYEYVFGVRAATVAVEAGELRHAARLLGALEHMEPPASLSPTDREDHRRAADAVAAALDPAVATATRSEGAGVPVIEQVESLVEAVEAVQAVEARSAPL
jgi:predicted ATPase